MKPDAKLSVKKERLAELTTDDLHRVAGAAVASLRLDCVRTLRGCTTAIICPREEM